MTDGQFNQLMILLTPLVLAFAGYIKVLADRVDRNAKRLERLENGGGDAKVDARLVTHGLLTAPKEGATNATEDTASA